MEKNQINKKQNQQISKEKMSVDDKNTKMSLIEKIDISIITISIIIVGFSGFSKGGFAMIIPIGIIYGTLRENIKNLIKDK